MRIGLFLGENTAPGESLDTHIARVQQAERDGFSSAWFTQELGLDALMFAALVGPSRRASSWERRSYRRIHDIR